MFDEYTTSDLIGAVALINEGTPGWRRGHPYTPPDNLSSEFMSQDHVWASSGANAEQTAAAARLVRRVAEACAATKLTQAVSELNQALHDLAPFPIFSRHGQDYRLHYHAQSNIATDNRMVAYLVALGTLITWKEWHRLGSCNAKRCDRMYIDLTRNASKRFCSAACMTRTKVAASRARLIQK